MIVTSKLKGGMDAQTKCLNPILQRESAQLSEMCTTINALCWMTSWHISEQHKAAAYRQTLCLTYMLDQTPDIPYRYHACMRLLTVIASMLARSLQHVLPRAGI